MLDCVQSGPSSGPSNTGGFRIANDDLLQACKLRLELLPVLQPGESHGGWLPQCFDGIHSVLHLLPPLVQMSLHSNMVWPKMPCPKSGGGGLICHIFYNFGLSSITVGHCYYLQNALREDIRHFAQLEVNLDISYRRANEKSHSENSYNKRHTGWYLV